MIPVSSELTDSHSNTSAASKEEKSNIAVEDGSISLTEGDKSVSQTVSLILCESSQSVSENNCHICVTEDELESIQEFSINVSNDEEGSEEDSIPFAALSACPGSTGHHAKQPTIYGKVVKSIQKSIRNIFRSSPTLMPSKYEGLNNIDGSPISSVSEDDSVPSIPTNSIHKTLLIDVAYSKPLLSIPHPSDVGKKCLVLDLDETLVHSTFQPVPNPDLVVPVHFGEGIYQPIYVCKRPGVDQFLEAVGSIFEIVLFTASLATYADPVIDFLDPKGYIKYRLYREDCLQFQGLYIKDLSRLGRDLDQILIIDNSPASYSMHPQNALACTSWFKDPLDRELEDRILPILLKLKDSDNVTKWRNEHLQSIETPYLRSHSFLSSFVH